MPRSRRCLVVRCSSAMPLYPCGGILDPWRYPCGSAAAPSARFLRTSAVAPVPAALLRFSGRAAARSARCPRPGAVAPISEAPMCLRSPPPVHRRCSRHRTAAPFLGARRAVPQGRSRGAVLCLPGDCRSANRRGAHRRTLRFSSVPLCPAVAPVPATALYLYLTAASPTALALAARPLRPFSVPLRPVPLRPSRRCRCALLPAANHRCSCRGPLTPILGTAALYSMPSAKCRSAHSGGVAAPPLGTVPPTVAALTPRSWRLSSAPAIGAAMRSRPRRYALPLTAAPLIAVARTADRRALTQYRRARCRSVHPRDAAVSSVNCRSAHRHCPRRGNCCVLRRYPI